MAAIMIQCTEQRQIGEFYIINEMSGPKCRGTKTIRYGTREQQSLKMCYERFTLNRFNLSRIRRRYTRLQLYFARYSCYAIYAGEMQMGYFSVFSCPSMV